MKQIIANTIRYITLSILIVSNISCNKNLIAEIPAYIEIHEFNYINNTENEKPYTSNHQSTKITDAWVTMDDQFLGAFEIPCKIPIHLDDNMQSSSHSFDIYPGIKVNGIAASRAKYPFYEKFTTDTILARNSTTLLNPTTEYSDIAIDLFDGLGVFELDSDIILSAKNISEIPKCSNTNQRICGCDITLSSNSATPVFQTETVFQGASSLAIYLNSQQNYFHISTDNMDLAGTTFLELNFKTSTTLNVGVIIVESTYETKEELIQLHPTNMWKKTYLDITPLINEGGAEAIFKIYLEGCGSNNSTDYIYIDNLKLISRS